MLRTAWTGWLLGAAALLGALPALAQGAGSAPPSDPGEPIEEIVGGTGVSAELQRARGLVTVNGGCSGTMLDSFWVLTARHCVTVDGNIATALLRPDQVRVTAAWAAGVSATATLIHELSPNRPIPGRDIILVLVGQGEFGTLARQPLLGRRLRTTDSVTQFGRGLSTLATGVFGGTPPAVPTGGGGVYRSGVFTPSAISGTAYDLAMNAANQVGHGGDSGGSTWLVESGAFVGIAGVQSTCRPTGRVPNAPPGDPVWRWATGIAFCSYVSVEPLVAEIDRARAFIDVGLLAGWTPGPACASGGACALPAIQHYVTAP
jgi:hypothetical protein